MKGIEKITARISAEAEEAAAAILSEGEETAASIRTEYGKRARDTFESLLNQGKEALEQKVQRAGRAGRLDAKKDILSLKQEMVGQGYKMAKELILAMPEADYIRFLAREAGNASLTGREELILSPEDRQRLGEKLLKAANEVCKSRGLAGEMTLSKQTRPIQGGLVLHQGDIEVNCTLDTLLELSRGSLDAEVARILFQ